MAKKAKKIEEEKTVIEIIKPSIEEQILGASDEVKTVKVVDYASLKRRYKVKNIVKNRSYELNGYEIGTILGTDNNATGIFAKEDGTSTDPRTKFGTAKFSPENTYEKTVIEVSTPQTWYTMGIKIYTQELGQGFFITSMELKNMKAKTKTRGR